jgi:Cys-rich protein (TIGR01571 family)
MAGKDWSHGLFSVFDDPVLCLKTTFLPCLVVGDIGEYVEPGGCAKNCCIWYCCMACCYAPICIIDMPHRAQVAQKAGIDPANVGGLPIVLCCNCCSHIQVMQEINEMKKAGGAPDELVMGAPAEIEMK